MTNHENLSKPFVFIFIMISESCFAQEIPVIKYRDLKVMETKRNDTTYVFNFWATWCSPCVKELPHFETALKNFKDEKGKNYSGKSGFCQAVKLATGAFCKGS